MVEFCVVQPVILKLNTRFHSLRCISETSAPSAVNVTSAGWITSKNYRGESQTKSLTQGWKGRSHPWPLALWGEVNIKAPPSLLLRHSLNPLRTQSCWKFPTKPFNGVYSPLDLQIYCCATLCRVPLTTPPLLSSWSGRSLVTISLSTAGCSHSALQFWIATAPATWRSRCFSKVLRTLKLMAPWRSRAVAVGWSSRRCLAKALERFPPLMSTAWSSSQVYPLYPLSPYYTVDRPSAPHKSGRLVRRLVWRCVRFYVQCDCNVLGMGADNQNGN